MQIQIDSQPYSSIQADALVTYVFEGDNKVDGVLADIDRRMTGGLATLVTSGEITGKALETVLLHFPEGMDAKRLLLVGAGKPGKFAVGDL
ncbi:MAG TPA: M17 family peptidase N-terminal domain-containing protein, partial [Candidatus Baltobacteraceae bacterium]|nr:M17 family peptidase N-terminal domain-containing protein [Candidatus Baltobacteraceae bacterium]